MQSILVIGMTLTLIGPSFELAPQTSGRVRVYVNARIEPGMTEDQVVGIIGAPPGDYRRDQRRLFIFGPDGREDRTKRYGFGTWMSDEGAVMVKFNDKREVVAVSQGVMLPSETVREVYQAEAIDRLLRLLRVRP